MHSGQWDRGDRKKIGLGLSELHKAVQSLDERIKDIEWWFSTAKWAIGIVVTGMLSAAGLALWGWLIR